MKHNTKILIKALQEGRKCEQCGWMITKERWNKIKNEKVKLCWDCEDANKGVNPKIGHWPLPSDWIDETGEMI